VKLYRIRRIDDGKFFAGFLAPWTERYRGTARWYAKGTFYSRIDTVVGHLESLASDWRFDSPRRYSSALRKIVKFYPERLDLYEVVINDVTLIGENIIPAADLVTHNASS